MKSIRIVLVAIGVALQIPLFAAAQPVAVLPNTFQGKFDFKVAEGTVLQATLQLPDGSGTFPLVVIMHGGVGISELEAQDVADLRSRGYATAVVNSFSGRNFKPESGTGAGASLRPTVRVADAYAALNVLVTHPQIDKQRTVLFGRSHAGATVMIAATTWAKGRYSSDGAAYKAFIALYPACHVTYPEFDSLTGPLRLHLGSKDDLTPAKSCVTIASRMQAHGQDVKLTVYPDAHHAFDLNGPVSYSGQWLNYGACNLQLASVDTPLPVDEVRQCVRRGTSQGGNPQATAIFRQNAAKELAELLR